ncbi:MULTISPECIES: HAMP domain-containing sensor histidine kinase [unclassified Crossiella]|uniref:HAMP domain-containing sensor histidine kinase n=1 Tax=unclassified Crossiella TaxID=2620835 RepID=UPI001FFFA1F5|nr:MULTISPECIES: HAMP domain-containing sensor histidine kinase [unclassified Crossiella]MCK2240236.1 HAMP domain-containing histidine kinase [Crossiella sp. S99.2]MCK2253312.1 HAMP domain-containing histidine kinase [Crossiella sp. S99.1]
MRSRLLVIVLSLVILVLLGLGVPLALNVAGIEQQQLFLDRVGDTSRFASLAQNPLLADKPDLIRPELQRYHQVHGISVLVTDRENHFLVSSDDSIKVGDPRIADRLKLALAGRVPETENALMPWDSTPLVLAEPVRVGGEVRGAVVTVSPTGASRLRVLLWWGVLALASVAVLCLGVLLALPIVRWTLRPVRRLDEATGRMVASVVSGRPVEPVGGDTGPPELRHLTRSFDQMAASVSDVLAAQRAFVADASHQLRNPLTALRLRLGNLEGHVHEDSVDQHNAAMEETIRLNQILDELLSMARAEASSVEPVPAEVDAAVAERVDAWRVVAAARGIALSTRTEPELFALAPPRGVETVLDALLDNALKFSPDRSSVVVSAEQSGELVVLIVRDHGPGLTAEELDRATDRFWRSPSHQNITGSGLGLAIVRRVVERAGGSVRLDLPEGGGLAVVVELPALDLGPDEHA